MSPAHLRLGASAAKSPSSQFAATPNISAQELPHGVDEFDRAGLEKIEALRVPVSRIKASPVSFECHHIQTLRLPGNGAMGTVDVVFGKVIGLHIDDQGLTPEGRISANA